MQRIFLPIFFSPEPDKYSSSQDLTVSITDLVGHLWLSLEKKSGRGGSYRDDRQEADQLVETYQSLEVEPICTYVWPKMSILTQGKLVCSRYLWMN